MRKGFTGFVLGLIAGIIGVIAAITVIFKKLSTIDGFVEKIKNVIVDGINLLLFGQRKRPYRYVPYTSCYNIYSSSYKYLNNVSDRISHKRFKLKGEAEEKAQKICDSLHKFGTITVEELYDILGIDTRDPCRKYLDTKFAWYEDAVQDVSVLADCINSNYYIIMPDPKKFIRREECIV